MKRVKQIILNDLLIEVIYPDGFYCSQFIHENDVFLSSSTMRVKINNKKNQHKPKPYMM